MRGLATHRRLAAACTVLKAGVMLALSLALATGAGDGITVWQWRLAALFFQESFELAPPGLAM
jgi:hypothetical protein